MITERELAVLQLRSEGKTQAEIAKILKISQPAVSNFERNGQKKITEAKHLLEQLKKLGLLGLALLFIPFLSEDVYAGTQYINTLGANQSIGNNNLLFLDNTNGRTGINTVTPSSLLHMSSSTSGDAQLRIEADTDNNNEDDLPEIFLVQDGGSAGFYIGPFNSSVLGGNVFRIGSRYGGIDYNEWLTIQGDSGEVGIGTDSPGANLDVVGTGRFSSTLTASNGFTVSAGTITLQSDSLAEAAINFATVCASTGKLYISGGNLACGTDDDQPDDDAEVPNAITVASGTLGSNTISSGAAWTFTNTLNMDSNTLYIDGTNNYVGIGVVPSTTLDVNGNFRLVGANSAYSTLMRSGLFGSSNHNATGLTTDRWINIANFTLNGNFNPAGLTIDFYPANSNHRDSRQQLYVHMRNSATDVEGTYDIGIHTFMTGGQTTVKDVQVVRVAGSGTSGNQMNVWVQMGTSWIENVPFIAQYYGSVTLSTTNAPQYFTIPDVGTTYTMSSTLTGIREATPTQTLTVGGNIGVNDVEVINSSGSWVGSAVAYNYGGTGLTSATEDSVMVGAGTSGWQAKTLPACTTGKLLYDTSTNAFSCGTDDDIPDDDSEVPNSITVTGTLGSNAISSGAVFTTAGTFTIGDNGDDIIISAADWDVTATGAANFLTVDTGQGANELYDMDQNVLTSSTVRFANLNVSSVLSSGSNTAGFINGRSFLWGTDGTETNYRWQSYLSSDNLVFYSRSAGETMTLEYATGDVGVGDATNPGAALDVYRIVNRSLYEDGIRVHRPNSFGQYAFMTYAPNSSDAYFGSVYTGGGASGYGSIHLRQYSSSMAGRDVLNIDADGDVGILDTTPTNDLDVTGTIGISDTTIIDASRNIVNAGTGAFSGAVSVATINTGSGAMELGDAAVADGDTNSVPTGDQVHDFVSGNYWSTAYLSGRSIADANTADGAGLTAYYLSSGASNAPSGTDHALVTHSYSNAWSTQMASDWRTNNWYVRNQENGAWEPWYMLWHQGNDGSGSGLDADTVDGQQAWHANNDGAGSGLDADLLDGISSAGFTQRSTASQTVSTNGGWFRVAQKVGANGRGFGIVNIYGTGGDVSPNVLQILWNSDWSNGSQIRILGYSGGLPISNIRATYNASTQTSYLEFQLNTGSSSTISSEAISMGNYATTATTGTNQGEPLTYSIAIGNLDAGSFRVDTGGNIFSPSIDTGQGATEVHLMNQNLQTTNSPSFAGLTSSNTFYVSGGTDEGPPTGSLKMTNDALIFGGNNNGLETNSAQISAGKHQANSLNIVGMGTASSNRRVDMWAEGGFFVGGRIYDKDDTNYWYDPGTGSYQNHFIRIQGNANPYIGLNDGTYQSYFEIVSSNLRIYHNGVDRLNFAATGGNVIVTVG